MGTRRKPDDFTSGTAERIEQFYSRKRLAIAAGDVAPSPGKAKLERHWGNASPEMLTGGIHTTPEMRDAIGVAEREVA